MQIELWNIEKTKDRQEANSKDEPVEERQQELNSPIQQFANCHL